MGEYMQEADRGKQFLLTKNGYSHTPDNVKHERKIGEPIRGFETSVPVSWIKKGYVEQKTYPYQPKGE